MQAFDEKHGHGDGPPLARAVHLREMTGGFTLLRIENSEPSSVTALLQEKDSDNLARLTLSVGPEDPPRLVTKRINGANRPADLAIKRMIQADALAALSARAEEQVKNDKFSGTVLIAQHDEVLLEKAFGQADRTTDTPVTLDTQFRIGSMNKMFTAVATLRLVETGKLSLNDAIGKHLPDYPNEDVKTKVTVRHLLTHTGGTGDFFGPQYTANRLKLREHNDYVELYGSRALLHEPGAEHRYSNYGYILLGRIIEEVTGVSYYEYMRRNIYEPAGMQSTDSLPETTDVPKRAAGYMRRNGSWQPNTETLPWRGTSAGGGYSTTKDLLRFAQALESGTLISKKMLAEATTPQLQHYGYGFGIQGEGVLRSYGHGGGAPGMNGELRIFPQLGYVLISLSNLDPPAATRLINFFANRMRDTP